jgi:hypothetical protein
LDFSGLYQPHDAQFLRYTIFSRNQKSCNSRPYCLYKIILKNCYFRLIVYREVKKSCRQNSMVPEHNHISYSTWDIYINLGLSRAVFVAVKNVSPQIRILRCFRLPRYASVENYWKRSTTAVSTLIMLLL